MKPGDRLGPYEVLAKLGEGGMGEVYKARDTRLDRTVAIKVLPPALARDPDRRHRFEREARAIASLTHPHICTLYEFDSVPSASGDAATDFLVMEHLDGETLAERLTKGPLTLPEALRLAIQVADALAAAHQHGIVHRDLKPGNVMLTASGTGRPAAVQAKLLDFGLAKLRAPGAGSELASTAMASQPLTGEGTIVGTLQYMAPEQLEGKEADARSDLFAFGAIVYEMVTGRRAFEGTSQASLIAAILSADPPSLTERAPLTPTALERVVRKCLAKEPDARWHDAHDLAEELRWILEDSAPRRLPGAWPPAPRRGWRATAAVASVAAIVAVGWWLARSQANPPPMRTIPLTSYPGSENDPALSPNGEQVAFTWRGPSGTGPFKLYVKLVDGGEPLLIHEGPGNVFSPAWSPDGHQIAFIRRVGAERGAPADGLFVVSALGGAARQLGTFRSLSGLSWSPDSRLIAVPHRARPDAPSAIYLLTVETGEADRLSAPPADYRDGDYDPRFSPDGRSVAFVRRGSGLRSDVYVMPTDGGEPQRVTNDGGIVDGLDWTPDGDSVVYSGTRGGQAAFWSLWRVPVDGRNHEPLPVVEDGRQPSLSREGGRLAYVKGDLRLWITRGAGPTALEPSQANRFASSTAYDYFPRFSPDGQAVAFTSHRSGATEIWLADADGSNPHQLTTLGASLTYNGSWSPDGRRIAFTSNKGGNFDVYTIDVASKFWKRLTTGGYDEMDPESWSLDGQWIYFGSQHEGRYQLFKIPAEGGEEIQVTSDGGFHGVEGPDEVLYFSKSDPDGRGPAGIWRMPRDGGSEVQVLPHGRGRAWTLYEGGICYVNFDAGPRTIECAHFEGGEPFWITTPGDSPAARGLTVSPDGRLILYVSMSFECDIMLVDNFPIHR